MDKLPIIIVAGPTACGKTDVSIELAKKVNGEIISADSMQVYKYMDIGTAKISKDEMQGIKHYLIDELYPDEEYSVAVFQSMAKRYMNEIFKKGKIPIIVGGTGFYINALLYDNEFTDIDKDDKLRARLYNIAKEKGNGYIHQLLREVDPEAAELIHQNNIKRVVRALEFFEQTNSKISDHNKEGKKRECKYNAEIAILNTERDKLYQRINRRVDKMIHSGLVDEVKKLLDMNYSKNLVSMQGLGYKEIVKYLEGQTDFDAAVFELKKCTRHFAKRQLTWFSRQLDGQWYSTEDFENTIDLADRIANGFCKNNM